MKERLPLAFRGRVIHGTGRGRTLGFPTANLDTELPDDLSLGIYAGWVRIGANETGRPALVYWGQRPTFNETEKVCEVFILEGEDDLYGTQLTGELTSFIRADQRFDSPTELIQQMHQDVAEARRRLVKSI